MTGKRFIIATAGALLAFGAFDAAAQGFYPRDWAWGRSGLFARDYITPTEPEKGYLVGDTSSAGSTRAGRLVFAAARVDQYCQQDGSPTVTVLDAPRGAQVSTDLGRFVAVGNDAGSRLCLGRSVRGTRVFYRGGAARGDRILLRVFYPLERLSYDHAVVVR